MESYPKLRPLDFQPVLLKGQQMWFLRDPLHLSEIQLFVPMTIAPILALADGTRTSRDIYKDFCHLTDADISYKIVADVIDRLDQTYLLENDRTRSAIEGQLAAYRSSPYRFPSIAGHGYPSDENDLTEYLDKYDRFDILEHQTLWLGRGLISPHIDYERGGSVYARVWTRAAAAINAADLIIIFGTDHYGGPGTITLTRQPYATPYGVLPTDLDLIEKLATVVGEEAAFAHELHHRDEHSIELSTVWLHHIIRRHGFKDKPMVPILVGSFQHYLANGNHPDEDQRLDSFIEILQEETNGRKVMAIASVDLAHVGPNFGDDFRVDDQKKMDIEQFDKTIIAAALEGNAAGWYKQIAGIQDQNRICGFAPTYLLLRYLGSASGKMIAYDQCPADPDNTSVVSICGLLID